MRAIALDQGEPVQVSFSSVRARAMLALAQRWVRTRERVNAGEPPPFEPGAVVLGDGPRSPDELGARGIPPPAVQLLWLGTHYRQPLHLAWQAIGDGAAAYRDLQARVSYLAPGAGIVDGRLNELWRDFAAALDDDLDTPRALRLLRGALKRAQAAPGVALTTLRQMDVVLGLELFGEITRAAAAPILTPGVMSLVEQRNRAREVKAFERADALRDELVRLGFEVEDAVDGTRIRVRDRPLRRVI